MKNRSHCVNHAFPAKFCKVTCSSHSFRKNAPKPEQLFWQIVSHAKFMSWTYYYKHLLIEVLPGDSVSKNVDTVAYVCGV